MSQIRLLKHLSLFLFGFLILNFCSVAVANQADGYIVDEREDNSGTIKYEKVVEYDLPYKQRRSTHGALFGVGVEEVKPEEYHSIIDGSYIGTIFSDTAIAMMNAELGYKYNIHLGSLYVIGAYGMGKTTKSADANSRSLALTRLNISAGYAADMLFEEPWVVPYGQIGVHQFSVTEKNGTQTSDATTAPSLNYRFGVMFQLNWIEKSIDPTTHLAGLKSSGLENTYLDLYASWYEPSQDLYDSANPTATSSSDRDLRSEGGIGLALKLEF